MRGRERCYWHEGVHIPMCWGAIHGGPEGCECLTPAELRKRRTRREVELDLIEEVLISHGSQEKRSKAIQAVRDMRKELERGD